MVSFRPEHAQHRVDERCCYCYCFLERQRAPTSRRQQLVLPRLAPRSPPKCLFCNGAQFRDISRRAAPECFSFRLPTVFLSLSQTSIFLLHDVNRCTRSARFQYCGRHFDVLPRLTHRGWRVLRVRAGATRAGITARLGAERSDRMSATAACPIL